MKSFKTYLAELSPSAIKKLIDKFINAANVYPDSDELSPEQLDEIEGYVQKFNELQTNHVISGVDPFQLSFEELKAKVDSHVNYKEDRLKAKQNKVEKVFDNDKCSVFRPKSNIEVVWLADDMPWCIKKEQWFDEYSKKNTIYVIVVKDEKATKYAFLAGQENKLWDIVNPRAGLPKERTNQILLDLEIPRRKVLVLLVTINDVLYIGKTSSRAQLNPDGSYDIIGSCNMGKNDRVQNIKKLPFKLRYVSKYMQSNKSITSMVGFPEHVGWSVSISFCKNLKSLKGCPKVVEHNFWAWGTIFTEEQIRAVCNVKGEVFTGQENRIKDARASEDKWKEAAGLVNASLGE